MKGPSFQDMWEALKSIRIKTQYFCPNCRHGPFYTAASETNCPACAADLTLTNIDGDILVSVVEKSKKRR